MQFSPSCMRFSPSGSFLRAVLTSVVFPWCGVLIFLVLPVCAVLAFLVHLCAVSAFVVVPLCFLRLCRPSCGCCYCLLGAFVVCCFRLLVLPGSFLSFVVLPPCCSHLCHPSLVRCSLLFSCFSVPCSYLLFSYVCCLRLCASFRFKSCNLHLLFGHFLLVTKQNNYVANTPVRRRF